MSTMGKPREHHGPTELLYLLRGSTALVRSRRIHVLSPVLAGRHPAGRHAPKNRALGRIRVNVDLLLRRQDAAGKVLYCYTECGSVPELITSSEFAASPIDGATLPLDTVLAWQGLGRGDSSWL